MQSRNSRDYIDVRHDDDSRTVMRSVSDFWTEMQEIPEARWIFFGTLLVFAILVAIYVSFYFRNLAIGESDNSDADMLSSFRELRDGGQLAEFEYSKLKRVIPVDGSSRSLTNGLSCDVLQPSNPDKPFLTLAEAESKKREAELAIDPEDNQADHCD